MISFLDDDAQPYLPHTCRHCFLPVPMADKPCPACGHYPDAPKSACRCVECIEKRQLAQSQKPRWLSPPRLT